MVDMPILLWGEAFTFALEVLNISPSSALAGETPYTRRFGERPELSNLRTWGCLAFAFTQKVLRKRKLENPGKPCIFLGYAKNSISYRVLDLRSGNIQEIRTVEFAENWTVERSYVEKLLLNRFSRGKYKLPSKIPYVRLNDLTAPSASMSFGVTSEDEPSGKRHCSEDLRDRDSRTVVDAPIAVGEPALASVPTSGLSSVNPARSAEAEARWSRARGLREWRSLRDQLDTDGDGGVGATGGVGLSNSSSSAPNEVDGDLSNRRVSVPVASPLALRDSDGDRMEISDSDLDYDDEATETAIGNGEPMQNISHFVGGDRESEDEAANNPSTSFRRSTRVRQQNVRLHDYEVDIPASLVIQAVNELLEPTSVEEALSAPDAKEWVDALDTEYKELLRNHVWELVDRPDGVKILKNKWVFVRKRNAQGEVCRYRTRITIKGCQQEYGINFWETYAPVAKAESVRFILLLALELGLLCRQVDFVTAFLNGPLDGVDIYMEQPDYFNDGTGRVCKLKQSLYGLRQAPRIWYKMLDEYLRKCGFKRTKMDAGVYVRTVGENKVFVTVYVDDLLIVGTETDIDMVLGELSSEFKIKDLGEVKHLLGMEITYVPGHVLMISQKGYTEKILARCKMDKCKPVPTPQVKGNFPMPGDPKRESVCVNSDPEVDYRHIVGSLQYLVQCTRPDIANSVRTLGKYLNCFTREHHVLAKRVLRYLRGTSDYGLVWTKKKTTGPNMQIDAYVDAWRPPKPEVRIEAYADADLGNEKDDRRSISGYVLQMEGCTYAYSSHKQRLITDDTCSSEFVAAAECSTMIKWTHNLCKELGVRRKQTVLYDDNQAAIAVIKANTGDFKVKGIDLKYHKIRDYYEKGDFALEYCPSEEMLADILTKPLGPTQFKRLRQLLNVVPVPDKQLVSGKRKRAITAAEGQV
ncbi:hypothetical protein PR003_g18342 [Phytophthora rubi]|uniref:Uncharacterized protein n=1 Tax=Phytophthora rubi TaxID=129364 RepID=A0A6A4E1H4_9STRA|nr:hypothetical protein PR002_g17714 [Phytophthora rubi]KAE9003466.1 hypothetical protein PR001_g17970 [Phytophthora rubi]KAE9318020.1 hypothetical protein PR003_g18342 [Phytophthora rubi]